MKGITAGAGRCGSTALMHGSVTVKRRAPARAVARHLHRALVQLDQALHQREADAQAALAAVERAVALHEEVEHLGQQLRLDAGAVVAHR